MADCSFCASADGFSLKGTSKKMCDTCWTEAAAPLLAALHNEGLRVVAGEFSHGVVLKADSVTGALEDTGALPTPKPKAFCVPCYTGEFHQGCSK